MVASLKPPIPPPPPACSKPQQYLHLARMFRDAAIGLPNYVGPEQNWPAYALLLHACELALKAFCDQAGANERASNHDLKGWHRIALQNGLPLDHHVGVGLELLSDLHYRHYMRYPDNRKPIPDISNIVDEVVERLIAAVSLSIYQR